MKKYPIEKNTGDHKLPFKKVDIRVFRENGEHEHIYEIVYGCDACGVIQQATRACLAAIKCIRPADKTDEREPPAIFC